MHEASLIVSLLRQVNEIAYEHGEHRVTAIHLEVGPLAGVEPLLLRAAFERQRSDSLAADAVLLIDRVGLTCRCRSCQLTFVTEELQFACPTCQRVEVDVTAGDAVVLHSVTLQDPMVSEAGTRS